jgi:hypothetical protein
MQVGPEFLRSVVFICEGQVGVPTPVPIGTAFLISPPALPGSKHRWTYLATAAHLIDDIADKDDNDGHVWVRFNGNDGKLTTLSTLPTDWLRHPDQGADVAAYRWDKGVGDHDVWSADVQLMDDLIKVFEVGPGDDVFIIGLFSKAEGKTRNVPIVRVGNIAAMPGEPIFLKKLNASSQVFLIEARSIGGLSGSPVFLHMGHMRLLDADKRGMGKRRTFKGLPKYWMGMIHGHYDVDQGPVNMGIAVVIPHERIVDVINSPKEIERRTIEEEKWKKHV